MGLKDLTFRILGKSMTGGATGKTLGELGKIDRALATIGQRATRTGRSMRNIGLGVTAAVSAPLALLARDAVRLYDMQVRAETAVGRAIESTNGAAGLRLEQLKAMASEMQKLTTLGDEEILLNITAPLLTFTKISKDFDIFERAQMVTADVATLLQTDLKSAVLQVGKALNDPIRGITGLSRAGIQFSDDQKQMIKSLVETGQVAKAQLLILTELETQFSGQAAALATTPLGKIKQLSNAWGDFKEELGGQIAPVLTPLVKKLTALVDWFQKLSPETKKWIVISGGVAAAIGPIVAGLGLMTIAIGALISPIGLIIGGLAALAAGAAWIYSKWQPVKAFFAKYWTQFRENTVREWATIKGVLEEHSPEWLKTAWGGLVAWFNQQWIGVRAVTRVAWRQIKAMLSVEMSPGELVYKLWTGIGEWFSGKLEAVVQAFRDLWPKIATEVGSWPGKLKTIGIRMVEGLVAGIVQKGADLTGAMDIIEESTASKLEELYGIKSPSRRFMEIGRNAMEGLRIGMANHVPALRGQMSGVSQAITSGVGNISAPFFDLFQGLIKGTTNFKDYFIRSVGQAGDALLKFAYNQSWGKLFQNMNFLQGGQFGSSSGGLLAGLISSLVGGIFGGGAPRTSPRPAPRPFAKGGIVKTPTHFPMGGGGMGVAGEKGWEGILPLTRVNGELGVRATAPTGGSGDTNIYITVDARGATDPQAVNQAVAQAIESARGQLRAEAAVIARATIKDAQRRGRI